MAGDATEARILTRDELLARLILREPVTQPVDVPGFGRVIVKKITKAEQTQIAERATIKGKIDNTLMQMHLFGLAVVDPKLSDDDVRALGQADPVLFDAIMRPIMDLNGMGAGAVDAAEAGFQG